MRKTLIIVSSYFLRPTVCSTTVSFLMPNERYLYEVLGTLPCATGRIWRICMYGHPDSLMNKQKENLEERTLLAPNMVIPPPPEHLHEKAKKGKEKKTLPSASIKPFAHSRIANNLVVVLVAFM